MNISIELRNLTLSYEKHPAIHHLNLTMPLNETIAIVGPNGAGKSTLLKLIMGFLAPDSGEIIKSPMLDDVAYLSQLSEIKRDLPITVSELIASGYVKKLGLCKGITAEQKKQISDVLIQVGLEHFEKRSIKTLSGGQLQRVLFARIMIQDASLILLDEPFNAIDEKTVQDLCGLIDGWQKAGKTVIAVIHDFQKIQQFFSYSVLLACELIAAGDTKEVFTSENIDNAYARTFYWDNTTKWCGE